MKVFSEKTQLYEHSLPEERPKRRQIAVGGGKKGKAAGNWGQGVSERALRAGGERKGPRRNQETIISNFVKGGDKERREAWVESQSLGGHRS